MSKTSGHPVIAQIPKEERPRERLLYRGSDALSLAELLAICLGNGHKGTSALALAHKLLSRFGSLSALFEASIETLTEMKGVGPAKAIHLKAVCALAKRLNAVAGKGKFPVTCPRDVYTFIAPEIREEKQEVVALMLRDTRGCIFHHEILGRGTLNGVIVHPREVFHRALHRHAYSVILAHNHPSGDPTPSEADLELTKLLVSSGRLLGIPLDDHLIIGRVSYVSLWEEGEIQGSRYILK
ncbi:RadC family protein [Candidatus Neptunochlamydia vexilliferae]|uniref:UPF0758 protein n=1 Tax=Candidatus Neptunichlamydia vexilliferae TaxID=1651774 RepID=A0ABS0AZ67_9BACT|nr:DNA repair protein RadC [Candidatus Neptunochlamydia vexilliferae]MBF5059423.1 UPF0758 protein [Candidatus Neptunochlamydia vexilliferae]